MQRGSAQMIGNTSTRKPSALSHQVSHDILALAMLSGLLCFWTLFPCAAHSGEGHVEADRVPTFYLCILSFIFFCAFALSAFDHSGLGGN